MTKSLKKSSNQSGLNKFKILVFLAILYLASGVFIVFSDQDSTSNSSPSTNNSYPERIQFDFQEILSENFQEYVNVDIGLKFDYPKEIKMHHYTPDELENITMSGDLLPFDGMTLLLNPKPWVTGIEFHDGLLITLTYYQYEKQIVDPILIEISNRDGFDNYESTAQKGFLNGKSVIIEHYCCYGGDSTTYHFFTNNNKYYVRIEVSTAGPDKDKFEVIARRILNSLEFN